MRPLFVTGSLVHGGAERHTITLANRLAERGNECHFAYVKNDPSQLERLKGAASVTCLHSCRYLDFSAIKKLGAMMARLRPSVVVAANQYALLYAALALRGSGVGAPLAVTYHTTQLRNAREWLQMLYYRPLFWAADCLMFVCDAQRKYWLARKLHGRSTMVIYNGVDLDHWQPRGAEEVAALRRALGFAAEDFVVGLSAVLRPEKNHLQLVEAIAALRSRGVPARALLIGDGPMRGAVEARASALGVAEHVLITGFQQDVRPFVSAADAMTLCSTAVETFSLAALEAMALARPVVHSDIGGAVDMIRPGREGFLFSVGDTGALVDRLALLAHKDAAARMGARARASVESRFSERAMVDRYEQVLQQLVKTRSKRENIRKPAGAY